MSEAITLRDFLTLVDPGQGIIIEYNPSTVKGRNPNGEFYFCGDLLTEDWVEDYLVSGFEWDEYFDPEEDRYPDIKVRIYDKKVDYAAALFKEKPSEEDRLKAFIKRLKKQRDELRKSKYQESFTYGEVSQLNQIIDSLQRELWKLQGGQT